MIEDKRSHPTVTTDGYESKSSLTMNLATCGRGCCKFVPEMMIYQITNTTQTPMMLSLTTVAVKHYVKHTIQNKYTVIVMESTCELSMGGEGGAR